jgi:hypothetical protein
MKCSAQRSVLACLLVTLSVSLIGCSGSFDLPDTPPTIPPLGQGSGDVHGGVFGGRQPIAGASIYLYGASNTAYSRNNSSPPAPISLLGNVVSRLSPDGVCDSSVVAPLYFDGSTCYYMTGGTSGNTVDNIGEFNLSGLYHCNVSSANAAVGTLPNQQVWIYSIGGYPGVVGNANSYPNPQAGLAAALGTCGSSNNFSNLKYIYNNEVSTVAFAYAVAGFASDAQHVSAPATNYSYSSGGNSPGLTNAFANAALLYDIQGGSDPGDHSARHTTPNASGTNLPAEGNGKVPYYMINSLANVIAACVNSDNPSVYQSSGCEALGDDVYGSTNLTNYASDTASIAIYIAQHPSTQSGLSASVSNLIALEGTTGPWSPNYSTGGAPTVPLDLTAAINYASEVSTPVGVAIDKSGNAFVSSSAGMISEISPNGTVSASSPALGSSISYLTIDSAGNIWTPSQSSTSLYKLSSALTLTTTYALTSTVSGVTTNLSAGPHQITADGSAVVYVADAGNGIIWFVKNNGTVNSYDDHKTAKDTCTAGVTGIAYDNHLANYIWTAGDGTTDNVCRLSAGAPSSVLAEVPATPSYIAVDSTGDAFVTAGGANALYELTAANDVLGPFNGGGLETPSFLTIDGGGESWIINNANQTSGQSTQAKAPSLSEFDNSGTAISPGIVSGRSGFQFNLLSTPSGIAIDQSGDVWVTNQAGTTNGNTIFELIGAAIPTAAPLYTGPGKLP